MFLSLAAADDSRFESRSASQTTNQHSSHRASLRSSCEALPDENISYKQTNYHYYHIHISCKHRRCKIKHWKLTIRKLKISSCQKSSFSKFRITDLHFAIHGSLGPGPGICKKPAKRGPAGKCTPSPRLPRRYWVTPPPPFPPLLGGDKTDDYWLSKKYFRTCGNISSPPPFPLNIYPPANPPRSPHPQADFHDHPLAHSPGTKPCFALHDFGSQLFRFTRFRFKRFTNLDLRRQRFMRCHF